MEKESADWGWEQGHGTAEFMTDEKQLEKLRNSLDEPYKYEDPTQGEDEKKQAKQGFANWILQAGNKFPGRKADERHYVPIGTESDYFGKQDWKMRLADTILAHKIGTNIGSEQELRSVAYWMGKMSNEFKLRCGQGIVRFLDQFKEENWPERQKTYEEWAK